MRQVGVNGQEDEMGHQPEEIEGGECAKPIRPTKKMNLELIFNLEKRTKIQMSPNK